LLRARPACGCIGLAWLLTACGGDGAGRAGGSREVELDVEHCAGFTAEDAASFLGVEAAQIKESSQPLGDDGNWCTFSRADDSSVAVTFTVKREESRDAAAEEFAQFAEHAGVAAGVLGDKGDKGDKAHTVADLGDEAIWSPVPGILVVRAGRYSLQVNAPSKEETQIGIARRLLEGK
jgi:hypothetical protein